MQTQSSKSTNVYSKPPLFTRQELKNMIVPLFFEQFLIMLVGMVDTLIVSYAGDAALSGVSLVNQFNNIFILLFSALASGGAVVISQYLGRKEKQNASKSASQLLLFSFVFSIVLSILVYAFDEQLLGLLFGRVEPDVMQNCLIYLKISVLSYPMLAIYNSGAAIYRSAADTKVTMKISMVANMINVVGNMIGIFVLHAGSAGVAWPTFLARTYCAIVITYLAFKPNAPVVYAKEWLTRFNRASLKQILRIALPNGMEDGIFQLVKVGLSSIVALFGTMQIAANGVAQSFWSLSALAGTVMGPVFITVIGRCMGQKDYEQATEWFSKLLKIALMVSIVWNLATGLCVPLFLKLYALDAPTIQLVFILVVIHNIFNALAFPFSGALAAGLRACGDVKFTMAVSILCTVGVRLLLSYLFGVIFNWGVIGIALAMAMDWTVRGIIFFIRLKSNRWQQMQVID